MIKEHRPQPSHLSLDSFRREVLRQTVHVVLGLVCMMMLYSTSILFFREFVIVLLLVGAIVSLFAEKKWVPFLNKWLIHVEREGEHVPGEAAFLFMLGVGLTSFIFSSILPVLVGIVAYTFQDSFSTVFGLRYGKTKILGSKSLEGSLAGLVGCWIPLSIIITPGPALVVAIVATLVELFPINDALGVPLASALVFAGMG
ncbi:MAG: hypothetical protein V1776_00735 [Candidatus Diapherotrites archaeon]